MMPQDPHLFKTTQAKEWLQTDDSWFQRLAEVEAFSVAEKVHIARVALQQQWICDVKDTRLARDALRALHLHIATAVDGFLVVSGGRAVAEYAAFRSHQLSVLEVGILYGYSPSAVVAFAGILNIEPNQPWPVTAGQYFLGGRFSQDFSDRERADIAHQWSELELRAPAITSLAEITFTDSLEQNAA
jgi:hypothetical protein